MKDAFGDGLAPLHNLRRLFLGIFLSDTNLLDDHIHHEDDGTVKNVYNCRLCKAYEKKTRRRELTASLIVARYLKSLKHIGWSTCFFWDSKTAQEASKEDESKMEEVAENELDNIAIPTSSGNFDHQCYDEECNIGLTTELFITRSSTRTSIERVV